MISLISCLDVLGVFKFDSPTDRQAANVGFPQPLAPPHGATRAQPDFLTTLSREFQLVNIEANCCCGYGVNALMMFWGRKLHTTPHSSTHHSWRMSRTVHTQNVWKFDEISMVDMHPHTYVESRGQASCFWFHRFCWAHTHMYTLLQTVGFCHDFQLCMCACKGRATCESHRTVNQTP